MVLCSTKTTPPVCEEFEAKINLLFHKKCIKIGFQCTVHVGSVCQTAEISSMSTVSVILYLFCLLSTLHHITLHLDECLYSIDAQFY